MTQTASSWRYVGVSVAGARHRRIGARCEDVSRVRRVRRISGDYLLLVACDGAGSARYAADGAAVSAKHFLRAFSSRFHTFLGKNTSLSFVRRVLLDPIHRELTDLGTTRSANIEAFATTLVGAVIGPHGALLIQVGDGAIAYRCCSGKQRWKAAFVPQRGEYINQTVFVTERLRDCDIQVAYLTRPPLEIAVLTDGLEDICIERRSSQPHPAFFDYVMQPVRTTQITGYLFMLRHHLAKFLRSDTVSRRTADDITLLLASRQLAA